MEIRIANDADTPEIVQVLKASLGEKDLPLSEKIWNFKHLANPFGKSLILVALEKNKIIGVRAFMRWQWQRGGEVYRCFRAVDTATHPDYQGRGIFKKLTLGAVNIAKDNKNDFIFNTPNENSRPGYLKMGWESVGQIKVKIAISSFFLGSRTNPVYSTIRDCSDDELNKLCLEWSKGQKLKNRFFTPKSAEYLKWRYETNPLQKYTVISTPEYYLAAYIKKRKSISELRIVESLYYERNAQELLKARIKQLAQDFRAQFISLSPEGPSMGITITGRFGPILTVNNLNVGEPDSRNLTQIDTWNYSLGDLELF